jgi:serpin B
VRLPKFRIEYGVKRLNNALGRLGMGIAFTDAADFRGIADSPLFDLFIDFVDHKAVIEVNEEGTEAAAATVVGIGITSVITKPRFIVNRPFFFAIRDDRSRTILFMGKIENPA